MQNAEPNTRTSKTTSARPNTKHLFDQPTGGQGPRIQARHTTPNTGASPGCSNINLEHYHPRGGEKLCMETPHTPHYRIGLSQTYSNISVSNINTPSVPNNIPPTRTKPEDFPNHSASGTYGDQHADIVPVIGRTPNEPGNQLGHNRPLKAVSHQTKNPQIPHQRIPTIQLRPGTSGDDSYGQDKLPNASSTLPETTPPSKSAAPTSREITPQQTKGNRSPIRFPTPEPENLPISSNYREHQLEHSTKKPRQNAHVQPTRPKGQGTKLTIRTCGLRSLTQKIT